MGTLGRYCALIEECYSQCPRFLTVLHGRSNPFGEGTTQYSIVQSMASAFQLLVFVYNYLHNNIDLMRTADTRAQARLEHTNLMGQLWQGFGVREVIS